MGEKIGPSRSRSRAVAFVLSTLLISLLVAAVLLVTWRTHASNPANEGVRTWLESVARPKPPPPHRTAAPRMATAIGNPINIPSDAVRSQMLTCFGEHRRDHPECETHWSAPSLASAPELPAPGAPVIKPPPTRALAVYTPAFRGALPPGACGLEGGAMVSVCARLPDPPPPSRSPEEICEAGGIGPCDPPAFRPEDVVHRRETGWRR